MRQELAQALTQILIEKDQPFAQTAKELGCSRQRLHQLKTGHRSALPEAIEDAINQLGYEVASITLRRKET